jgi:hypothetical protein
LDQRGTDTFPDLETPELNGLYNRGSFRCWRIRFPYYFNGIYLYFGSKEDAKSKAEELAKKHNYIYRPSIRELTKI